MHYNTIIIKMYWYKNIQITYCDRIYTPLAYGILKRKKTVS